MSERILKLLSQEIALSTAQTMNGAQLVRLWNNTSNPVSIVVKDGSTITGSFTMRADGIEYVRKKANETIEATAAVRAVIVAFGD